MTSDDTGGKRLGTPVVLRIKLKYDSVEALVHRFAPNVGKSGIFLPTRSIHPPGTEIKFELRLATDVPVLVGLGRVQSGHEPDPANPRAIFGMAIEIIRVTREGRQILVRMIERRRAMGLPEVTIPIPADLDAARRADVETQPRAQIPTAGKSLLPSHTPTVLTAPRSAATPLVSAADTADRGVALELPPEPPRRVRRRVSAVIAAARQPAADVLTPKPAGILDGHVDLATTVARARSLATGNLDDELAALAERAAAPLAEITVETASAELARHLGGAAVKRDRSAPVVVQPAPTTSDPRDATEADQRATITSDNAQPAPEPQAPAMDASPGTAPSNAAPPNVIAEGIDADPPAESEPPAEQRVDLSDNDRSQASAIPAAADEETPREFEASLATGTNPEQTTAAPEELAALPSDEPAPPQTGAAPSPAPLASAAEVEQDQTEGEGEDEDDPELLSFERALDAARIQTGVSITPAPPAPQEPDPPASENQAVIAAPDQASNDDEADELDDDEIQRLRIITPPSGITASEMHQSFHEQAARIARPMDGEEISDVDVLAEANAEDDDLLHAHRLRGQLPHEAPVQVVPHYEVPHYQTPTHEPLHLAPPDDEAPRHEAPPLQAPYYVSPAPEYLNPHRPAYEAYDEVRTTYPAEPPGHYDPNDFDFASRLDLDDDAPENEDGSSSYTFAEQLPRPGNPRRPVADFDDPYGVVSSNLEDTYGLDDALSNLDADPDPSDLPYRSPSNPRPRPLPGLPDRYREPASPPRTRRLATEGEGVVIDFDDDDDEYPE